MRCRRTIVVVGVIALACSAPPPPPPPKDAGPPVVCCTPSPEPACCMQIGGAEIEGVCPDLTCDIPDPATPGWRTERDSDGCLHWVVPPGPFACGAPPVTPIEAAPPCAPVSVASYVSSPMTPPNPPTNACTGAELGAFYDACIDAGVTSAACAAFESSDASCAACLLSKSTDATWGPVVTSPGRAKPNVAGCIALVQGDASASSCAQRASDELGCEAFACDGVCPVTPDAGGDAYAACTQGAAVGGCHAYVAAECDLEDAGLDACRASPFDASAFASLGSVFCGGA